MQVIAQLSAVEGSMCDPSDARQAILAFVELTLLALLLLQHQS